MKVIRVFVLLVLSGMAINQASAMTVAPGDPVPTLNNFIMTLADDQGHFWDWEVPVPADGSDGEYTRNWTGADVGLNWGISFNSDPFILSTYSLTNLSGVNRQYTISTVLPILGGGPASLIGGSIFAQLADTNTSGSATLSGTPIYRGLIDGVSVLDLLGFTASVGCGGAGCSTTISDLDGIPNVVMSGDSVPVGAFLNGPAVANTIGIDLIFTLSPGDTVQLQSYFEVTPVPVPAAVWLLGSGLLGLFSLRYHHRRK